MTFTAPQHFFTNKYPDLMYLTCTQHSAYILDYECNKYKVRIPFSKLYILFNNSYVYALASLISCCFIFILHQQRVVSTYNTILFIYKHQTWLIIHLPIQSLFCSCKCRESWSVIYRKSKFISYGFEAFFS